MRARQTWVPVVASVLVVSFLLQGCISEKKTISDTYTVVFGAEEGEEQQEAHFIFSKQWCIPDSTAKFNGKIDNGSTPPPTSLQITFRRYDTSDDLISERSLTLEVDEDGRIRKQIFSVSGTCFDPGQGLRVFFTPFGGDIATGAALFFVLALIAGSIGGEA
jgi:hypothetical protein